MDLIVKCLCEESSVVKSTPESHSIARAGQEIFLVLEYSGQRRSIDGESEERRVSMANSNGKEEKESGSARYDRV